MSIFQKLGNIVKALVGTNNSATVDKLEVLNNIESLLQMSHSVLTTLTDSNVITLLQTVQDRGLKNIPPATKTMQAIYQKYFQNLSAKDQHAERLTVFSTIVLATTMIEKELTALRDNFSVMFGGVETAELRVDSLTITSAAALGWLANLNTYFSWITYFIGNIGSNTTTPPYQLILLDKQVEAIARYTSMVAAKPNDVTIVSLAEAIRKSGADLPLIVDGSTIDNYASEQHYASEITTALNGFTIRNPALLVGNWVNVYRERTYTREKLQRDWLASRIGYLTLLAQNADPESAEFKRLTKITQNYAEMIAQLDKKLGIGRNE